MSYELARSLEIRDAHARRIEDFAREYRPGRPTVVFLPGGMGFQLDRSDKPYRDDTSLPFRAYDPVWIDWGLVFGQDALDLEIRRDGRDRGGHIVVPNGPLRFLAKPYDGTVRYLRERGYNFIVFAFDWRRSVAESAGYLHAFLRRLRERVTALRGENPLPHTTILCHSMGGLVAKIFLHRAFRGDPRPAELRQWMAQLVTVATPFYGTANHMSRYYAGQAPLNALYGTRPIARISGTLPGPYILMFLDRATYRRDGADNATLRSRFIVCLLLKTLLRRSDQRYAFCFSGLAPDPTTTPRRMPERNAEKIFSGSTLPTAQ